MSAVFESHHGWVVDVVADGVDMIGWRAMCSCSRWHGRPWQRAERAVDHAPAERRLHCPGGRLDAVLTRLVLEEWECHHFEMQALMPVRLAFQDSESARQRLVEAVRFVRSTGASWESIGQAIGTESAEVAEQRFGVGPWRDTAIPLER
ncbi:hypothetical protein ACFVAV_25970 [Nocardia sp. NPDC057663]|uniref:hypothetical protein n=1 Tax=Nocardia sp. NPDC057663 TaxID=3346201 RepID=UPI0036715A3D